MPREKTPNVGEWLSKQPRRDPFRPSSIDNVSLHRPRVNRSAINYLVRTYREFASGEAQHLGIVVGYTKGQTSQMLSFGRYSDPRLFLAEVSMLHNQVDRVVWDFFDRPPVVTNPPDDEGA